MAAVLPAGDILDRQRALGRCGGEVGPIVAADVPPSESSIRVNAAQLSHPVNRDSERCSGGRRNFRPALTLAAATSLYAAN